MNEPIIKIWKDKEISFLNSQTPFIHATPIAQQFGKLLGNWLKTAETQEYIKALANFLNSDVDSIVIIKKGGNPKEQGTWLHPKLAIFFARWLSPEFAVWCDMTIEEILKSQTSQPIQPQTQTSQNLQLPEIGNSTEQIIELHNSFISTSNFVEFLESKKPTTLYRLDQFYREFYNFSPLETFKINLESQYFLPTELGRMINKSPVEINLMIEHKGFQIRENGIWKLTKSGRDFGIEIVGKFSQIKWNMKTII